MRYAVIMAGGSGTRLWPLSRRGTPKQLLRIVEGRSLLRLAFERALHVVPAERIVVVTGAGYLDAVRAELPEVLDENLMGEPVGRDSLNAVAWPAAVIVRRDPDAVIAQLTADHLIEPVDAFVSSLVEAFTIAEEDADALVTLGVVPTSAHTGYGYLERGPVLPGHPFACQVEAFTEKPGIEVAAQYVASGDYWWNAGMFVWRASTVLEQLRLLEPETHAAVLGLAERPETLAAVFPGLKKISVDYALMEPVAGGSASGHVVAVALPITWRDVGGYASLMEFVPRDAAGNAVQGLAVLQDARDNLVINTAGRGHVVAAVGVEGLIVVQTPDATLVTTIDNAEQVKALVTAVSESAGPHFA